MSDCFFSIFSGTELKVKLTGLLPHPVVCSTLPKRPQILPPTLLLSKVHEKVLLKGFLKILQKVLQMGLLNAPNCGTVMEMESKTHRLSLQQRYYDLIQCGKKKHEGRTNTGVASMVKVDDTIVFTPNDFPENNLRVIVKKVKHYNTF